MQYQRWIQDWKTALAENFFLRSLTLLMAIALILSVTVFRKQERIIITPPQTTKEYWVESNKVSPEYMEQMGNFFATLAGNLSPANAEYNAKILSGYVISSNYNQVKSELAAQALYVKKNNITQSFFPVAVEVDETDRSVIVSGDVVFNVGTKRVSKERMDFHIKFLIRDFKLMIDELYIDYPERKKAQLIKKGEILPDESESQQ